MTIDADWFAASPEEWLDALPGYQRARVRDLLAGSENYELAAERWLTARPDHTAPFGAAGGAAVFKDKLWLELEKFLCGDPSYEEHRQALRGHQGAVRSYSVGVISAAIAPALGASGVFLAPAVVLLFASVGTIGLNAWCVMRKELHQESAHKPDDTA